MLAEETAATAILIWVKTPLEIAVDRGITRADTPDQRQKTRGDMEALILRQLSEIEEPKADEVCIEIDGTLPFPEQYEEFQKQLDKF